MIVDTSDCSIDTERAQAVEEAYRCAAAACGGFVIETDTGAARSSQSVVDDPTARAFPEVRISG